jgi:hypothetical protein
LAFLLVPLPVMAQGPRPVGLEQATTRERISLSDDGLVGTQRRGGGTDGFVIGFAVGFFATAFVLGADGGGGFDGGSEIISFFGLVGGLIGGFVGYLIRRER